MKTSTKKDEILNCAQFLIQKRGYNGFSYADIAAVVGIRKASIHHYFPTKGDLAVAVIGRYKEDFNQALLSLDSKSSWVEKIEGYAELYKQVLDEEKLCLCGMLASDLETLPDDLRKAIKDFFKSNVLWLVKVLAIPYKGLSEARLTTIAWQIVNQLQAGVIMARVLNDSTICSSTFEEMMLQLKNRS